MTTKEQEKYTHECNLDSEFVAYGEAIDYVYEDKGKLWAGNGEYYSRVNYCPVCGYKAINPIKNMKENKKIDYAMSCPDDCKKDHTHKIFFLDDNQATNEKTETDIIYEGWLAKEQREARIIEENLAKDTQGDWEKVDSIIKVTVVKEPEKVIEIKFVDGEYVLRGQEFMDEGTKIFFEEIRGMFESHYEELLKRQKDVMVELLLDIRDLLTQSKPK